MPGWGWLALEEGLVLVFWLEDILIVGFSGLRLSVIGVLLG